MMRVPRRSQAGFSLIEVLVSLTGVSIVLGGSLVLMMGSQGAMGVGQNQSSLQETGRRILQEVIHDIRRSGMTTDDDGNNYPAIYLRPIAPREESKRGDLFATMNYNDSGLVDEVMAYEGDGTNRIDRNRDRETNELLFQQPVDLDGDGRPIDAEGQLEWGEELISYRVEADAVTGIPWLVRVTEDGSGETDRRRVGPWVQNVTFDVVLNDRSLRFSEVAVVLYLQRQNDRGQTITAELEGSVVLRNTREL